MALSPAQAGGERLRASLSSFFTSSVTILRLSEARDEHGEPQKTWSVLADHCELAAMVAGGDVGVRMKKQEFRTAQNIHEMLYRRVLLNGYYPNIRHEDRARFEDYDWAIVSVVTDVTNTFTELLCESIEPGDI